MFKRITTMLAALVFTTAFLATGIAPARALSPDIPFSANGLPTWQTNGIVWSLAQQAGVIYAGGTFSTIRPAGAAAGTQSTDASNFAAFDANTGNPTSCQAEVTGGSSAVRALAVSPDGNRLYIGGNFGQINGTSVTRLAALSLPGCTLDTSFAPAVISATVRAISVTNDAVYVGGDFLNVGGASRGYAAAFSPTGELLPWAPVANQVVRAVSAPQNQPFVMIGGDFSTVNGSDSQAIAVVDNAGGSVVRSYPVGFISQTSVTKVIINDDQAFYIGNEGTGGGVFDGRLRIDFNTLNQAWRDTCLGATQALTIYKNILYAGHHAHDCSTMGQFADGVRVHLSAQKIDNPAPLLGWWPDTNGGTGEQLGPRSMVSTNTGTNDMLWVAGEFTQVNGVAAQSLTRFGPGPGTMAPTAPSEVVVESTSPGANKISWRTGQDRDDSIVTYNIYRDASTTPMATVTAQSSWWNQPQMSYLDRSAVPGTSYTYRVRATDGKNLSAFTADTPVTTATSYEPYAYTVKADAPSTYWRLGQGTGIYTPDSSAGNNLGTSFGDPVIGGTAGALASPTAGPATQFDGSNDQVFGNVRAAAPTQYSVEAWFKTSTTRGGKIFGFGSGEPRRDRTSNQLSGSYDRQVYMTNQGRLIFGAYTNTTNTVTPNTRYNNNKWHHVVATQGSAGMRLYVDGALVGSNSVSGNQDYVGSWKVGGDNLSSWPSSPSSNFFAGAIDDFAVYPQVLTASQALNHYRVGTGVSAPTLPADAVAPSAPANVTTAVSGNSVSVAWDASTDNVAVTGYAVHRGSSATFVPSSANKVGTTNAATLTLADPGVAVGTYYYRVVALDAAGNDSLPSDAASAVVVPPDTQAPTVPGNVNAAINGSDVTLTWNASTDNTAVTGYTVHRGSSATFTPSNANKVGTTDAATRTLTDPGVADGTSYYRVVALDAAGNESLPSTAATAVIVPPDTQAPSAPANVATAVNGSDVTLTWNASTDNTAVTGYDVHRGTTATFTPSSANKVGTTTATTRTLTDPGLADGTYYYRVVALDAAGNESQPSDAASATTPAAVVLPPVTMTLQPEEDTYVNQGAPSSIFGAGTTLASRGTSAYISYMKFNLDAIPAGRTLQSATLRMTSTTDSFAGSAEAHTVGVVGGAWSEASTNYTNRPALVPGSVGTLPAGTGLNTNYTVALNATTLSGLLDSGVVNLSVTNAGTDNFWFYSSEAPSARRPVLTLTFVQNP